MFARSSRILVPYRALAGCVLVVAGCRTMEVRAPIPVGADDMGRSIGPLAPDRGWGFVVETGVLAGPPVGAGAGSGERVGAGLFVAVRAEPGLPGTATTHAVEEYRPSALPVGTVRWPRGALGFESGSGGPSDDVAIEWMIGVRSRGSCAVDVDLVPRLTPSCGAPRFLESLRLRRTVALGDAVVLTADPAAGSPSDASRLVGMPAGRAGRFVIRIR